MIPYFLLIFLSAGFPFVVYQSRGAISASSYDYLVKKRNEMTVFLFFLGLFILLSLRDITVGKDLSTYKFIYEICSAIPFKKLEDMQWELGYTVFNKIVSMFFNNYRFFLILTAFITLFPIYRLYYQEKRYSFLLVVLFINMPCFLMLFSGLRQAIAISIGVIVYMLMENKRYILSALFILLAISFHISAVILILLYPMYFFKIKTKHLLYIIPAMLIVYVLRVPILSFIIGFMPSHYIAFYGKVQQTGAFGMMILFLIFLAFSFVILDETVMSKKDYFMRNVLLIATGFQFFVPIHGLIQRASYYFLIFVPVAILSIVNAPKRRLKNISDLAVVVMGLFFTLYFFCNAYFSNDNLLDVFPYKFFWSD